MYALSTILSVIYILKSNAHCAIIALIKKNNNRKWMLIEHNDIYESPDIRENEQSIFFNETKIKSKLEKFNFIALSCSHYQSKTVST